MKSENNRNKGNKFEDAAIRYLTKKGYKILGRNFHYGKIGEIDIIAELKDVLVFVEVKGRENQHFGPGENSITRTKKKKLIISCYGWIQINKQDRDWQIDVIAIDEVEINFAKVLKLRHYKNCITQNDY